jgi:hypothetical protein
VRSYLEGNFGLFSSILNDSRGLLGSKDNKHKVSRTYWMYLNELRKWYLDSNRLIHGCNAEDGVLYVIGESHSLSAHGALVNIAEKIFRCSAQWIAGCKQWHLGNSSSNRYKNKFESIVKNLPSKSSVLLTIGEIDCRLDEGVVKVVQKYPNKKLEDVINDTINGYIEYLTRIAVLYDQKFIVGGVPALNIPLTIMNENLILEHAIFIQKFNAILKENALKAGMGFLDVFALTDRGDGLSNQKWHIDSTHLKPSAFANAFDQNYLILN